MLSVLIVYVNRWIRCPSSGVWSTKQWRGSI